MKKKKLGSVLLAIIILLCMSGCSGKQVYQPIDDVSDLGGAHCRRKFSVERRLYAVGQRRYDTCL